MVYYKVVEYSEINKVENWWYQLKCLCKYSSLPECVAGFVYLPIDEAEPGDIMVIWGNKDLAVQVFEE